MRPQVTAEHAERFPEHGAQARAGAPSILAAASCTEWGHPRADLLLAADEVHLWRASLDADDAQLHRFWLTLSADERDRASRFHFLRGRQEFTAARGILRILLGRYTSTQAGRLRFAYGPKGKPYLAGKPHADGVRFNLSHSNGIALYAFSLGREVGVDVECMRAASSSQRIAQQFFSPREAAAIRRLPAHLQSQAFLACWTGKEAWLKAKGAGLGDPWNEFEVSLSPEGDALLLRDAEDSSRTDACFFESFRPAPGYVGAFVALGGAVELHRWDWAAAAFA